MLNSSKKEIFLKYKAKLPAEKRNGVVEMQGMRAATISCNNLVLRLLGLRLLDPLLLPGRVGSSLDPAQQREHQLLALAQAAPPTLHSQKKRPMKEKTCHLSQDTAMDAQLAVGLESPLFNKKQQ